MNEPATRQGAEIRPAAMGPAPLFLDLADIPHRAA